LQKECLQAGLDGAKERVDGHTYRKSIYQKLIERTRESSEAVGDRIVEQLKAAVKEFLDKITASLNLSVGNSDIQDRLRIQYLKSPDGVKLVKEMDGLMEELETLNVQNGFSEPKLVAVKAPEIKTEGPEATVVNVEPIVDVPATGVDADEDSLFVPGSSEKKRKHDITD
jgi:hypothetical protein